MPKYALFLHVYIFTRAAYVGLRAPSRPGFGFGF